MRQVGAMVLPPLTALALLLGVLPAQVQESQGSQATPEVAHGPPKPPDAHGGVASTIPPAPVPSPTPIQRSESPVNSTIRVAAVPAPVPSRPIPARTVNQAGFDGAEGWITTVASHYTPRPSTCWDPDGPKRVPAVAVYTAAHYPCGTLLEVVGPAGSAVVGVWDHGPWGFAERGLDASPALFQTVVGSLSTGVGTVRYRVVSGG